MFLQSYQHIDFGLSFFLAINLYFQLKLLTSQVGCIKSEINIIQSEKASHI